MSDYYILRDRVPVATDMMSACNWHRQFFGDHSIVGKTDLEGAIHVSTVFLILDHGWNDPKPLLFETLVSGGNLDGEQQRYHTWEEAEAGHKAMVDRVIANDGTQVIRTVQSPTVWPMQ